MMCTFAARKYVWLSVERTQYCNIEAPSQDYKDSFMIASLWLIKIPRNQQDPFNFILFHIMLLL